MGWVLVGGWFFHWFFFLFICESKNRRAVVNVEDFSDLIGVSQFQSHDLNTLEVVDAGSARHKDCNR